MKLDTAIADFLTGYFATCSRSRKTFDAYRLDLSQAVTFFGARNLHEIGGDETEKFAQHLGHIGFASVSIKRKFASLRVFFNYWVRKGVLEASPLWRIRLNLATDKVLPKNLAESEMQQLLDAAWALPIVAGQYSKPSDPEFIRLRNLVAFEILLATGIRVGELASLNCDDWRSCESTAMVRGKGSRQRLALFPDRVSIGLVNLYLQRRTNITSPQSALLLNARGGRLSTQSIRRILRDFQKRTSIKKRITPHMLRHTVATLLLRNGADIRIVQEILGHSSIATTQRYTHVSKEHIAASLQKHHPATAKMWEARSTHLPELARFMAAS